MKDALDHQLALAVGALWHKGVSLWYRQGFWGAVRRAGRREEKAAHTRPSQTLEQAEGATHVVAEVLLRLVDRLSGVLVRGEVDDRVDTKHPDAFLHKGF